MYKFGQENNIINIKIQIKKNKMENQKQIPLQKLNQLYTKLIKIFLNGTLTANNPYITSFYHDPSPDQAYILLHKILGQQINIKKDAQMQQNNVNNMGNMKKFQMKRAMNVGQEREYIHGARNYQANNQYGSLLDKNNKKMYTDFSNNINTIATTTYNTNSNTSTNNADNNTNNIINMNQNPLTNPYDTTHILQKQTINKTQKLQRLTAKLTQIFQNNQKKIGKYQQMSKYNTLANNNNSNTNSNNNNNNNISSQLKYARPVQIGSYKKY